MKTDMDCRSLGERKANYTTNTGTSSSIHQMKQKDTSSKKKKAKAGAGGFTAGLLAGAGVGVLAGLLLAPEKGTATRKKVAESAKKYSDQVTSQVNDLKNKMNKGGGQSNESNDDDTRPTTATGRAFTSTGGPAHGGSSQTSSSQSGSTQNSPYTDPNKRSDNDVKSMINDPKTPGATGGPSIPPKV